MAALEECGCLRIHVSLMPESFIKKYKLDEIVDKDGHVYAEVHGGIHGFLQGGTLARKCLDKRLTAHGHEPTTFTPGLWTHETNEISFTLGFGDFGVKHTSISSLNHLFGILKKFYSIIIDIEEIHVLEFHWNGNGTIALDTQCQNASQI